MLKSLSPAAVKKILDDEKNIRLIDVREEWEYKLARIENSELMPLSNFHTHIKNLSPEEKIVLYCHHGNRSFAVGTFLMQNGFSDVINLRGGINAWSEELDSSIPQY